MVWRACPTLPRQVLGEEGFDEREQLTRWPCVAHCGGRASTEVLLEPCAGQFQQLRRRLKIDLGPDDVLVPEIRRQQRQLGVDVDTVTPPRP